MEIPCFELLFTSRSPSPVGPPPPPVSESWVVSGLQSIAGPTPDPRYSQYWDTEEPEASPVNALEIVLAILVVVGILAGVVLVRYVAFMCVISLNRRARNKKEEADRPWQGMDDDSEEDVGF